MKRGTVMVLLVAGALQVLAQTAAKDRLPWFGMSVRPQRDRAGERFLHVERVTAEGPASRAGIQPGDIITRINRNRLLFADDLDFLLFIGERKIGERVAFSVVRDGSAREFVLTVAEMTDSARPGWQRALEHARQLRMQARHTRP